MKTVRISDATLNTIAEAQFRSVAKSGSIPFWVGAGTLYVAHYPLAEIHREVDANLLFLLFQPVAALILALPLLAVLFIAWPHVQKLAAMPQGAAFRLQFAKTALAWLAALMAAVFPWAFAGNPRLPLGLAPFTTWLAPNHPSAVHVTLVLWIGVLLAVKLALVQRWTDNLDPMLRTELDWTVRPIVRGTTRLYRASRRGTSAFQAEYAKAKQARQQPHSPGRRPQSGAQAPRSSTAPCVEPPWKEEPAKITVVAPTSATPAGETDG